ncbi:MAG: T9SS type A sorting domain-containing protein [Chitinophagales bacterium]|nr:T9SS type A sorting domain-containing protein [Chitinophagales bacterium]MDW8272724.1 T9SS type A sorting domain-containing protein [Chitinophagales bacterium]
MNAKASAVRFLIIILWIGIHRTGYPSVILQGDTLQVCSFQFPILLRALPGAQQYLWSTGSNTDTTYVSAPGKYWLRSVAVNGMVNSDTIIILEKQLSVETFKRRVFYNCYADTPWLAFSGVIYDTNGFWNNGQKYFLSVSESGVYWFTSYDTTLCLQQVDSLQIIGLVDSSQVYASSVLQVCSSSFPIQLETRYGDNPIWFDSISDYTITIDSPGIYYYRSEIGACADFFDTLYVIEKTITRPKLCCDTVICFPDSVIFELPAGFSDYFWSTGEVGRKISLATVGTFDVYAEVADSFNCRAYTDTIRVEIKDNVTKPEINRSGNFLITPTIGPGYKYQWYRNDSILINANEQFISLTVAGIYCISISNGTCADSSCYIYNIISSLHSKQNVLRTYPNPAKNILFVEPIENITGDIYLYSLLGERKQVVVHKEADFVKVDVSYLEPGVYFLVVQDYHIKIAVIK